MTELAYDALVIGSGPNGLAAGITLARQRRSVLILEARPIPGGAVATEELTLPGFAHDTYSSVYPAGAASPIFARMPLARYGLQWVHPPVAMAHPLPDGRAAALYRSVDQTAANLDRLAAGDGQRWQAFIAPYLKQFAAVRGLFFAGFPPVVGGLRLLAALRIGGVLDFARLLLLPATALAGELFHSPGSAAWLYGSALHGDAPLDSAGSAITAVYLNLLGHGVGWPSPRGGAGNLTRALVRYFQALGGQLETNAPVVEILVEQRRVVGVRLASGATIRARLVVGNLTPRGLLRLTGDALPSPYRERLERYRYGDPSIKVDWALAGPIPWRAPELCQAGTVHIGGNAPELERNLLQVRSNQIPERPFMLMGQQSLADPTRTPAGQHTAWAYSHPPRELDWSGGSATERDYVERMEQHIEEYAPGFRDLILARHVISPESFERRNANLIGGDVGGGSYALDQLVFRPVPALFPYRTPIRGLYLGSASTFPGAAVHGAGGQAAARLALIESRLP